MSIAMPQYETPKKPRRMPLSQKRIDANRRNARRSTGPRTAEGKRRSAQNAQTQHSKICGVDASVTTENDGTFFCHVQDMHDIFKPHTVLQQQLFPQLCALQWTLDRMIESEVKIYRALAKRADEPPCEIIARVFVENPTRNPLVAFERYWRRRQAEYWKLVKEYDRISKRPDTVDPHEQWQWDEARRLQEERERRRHGEAMARLAAEARGEVERMEGGTAGEPEVKNEPTSGGENVDGAAESAVCAIVEEKTKPVADGEPCAFGEAVHDATAQASASGGLGEGDGRCSAYEGMSGNDGSFGDGGGRCPPYESEATSSGENVDGAAESAVCAIVEEKTKPVAGGGFEGDAAVRGAKAQATKARELVIE